MRCAVFNCINSNEKKKQWSFFTFPKDASTLKKWIDFCGRQVKVKTACVCSAHFVADDFESNMQSELGFSKKKPKLRRGAIPTVFPPSDSQTQFEPTSLKDCDPDSSDGTAEPCPATSAVCRKLLNKSRSMEATETSNSDTDTRQDRFAFEMDSTDESPIDFPITAAQQENSNNANEHWMCKTEPEEVTEQTLNDDEDEADPLQQDELEHDQHVKNDDEDPENDNDSSADLPPQPVRNLKQQKPSTIVSPRPYILFNKRVEKYKLYITVSCPKCNLTLEGEDFLRKHVEEAHNTPYLKAFTFNRQNVCTVCNIAVNSAIYLRMIRHSVTHMPHPMYKCNLCDQFGDMRRQRIIKHIEDKHFKLIRPLDEEDPNEVPAASKLDVYKEATEHICPRCGESFATGNEWREHINKEHQFNKLPSLNITVRMDTEAPQQKVWQCNECGMESRTQLMQSMRVHAFTHMPFRIGRCKICNKVFSQHNELRLHIETQHIDRQTGQLVFDNPDLELEAYIQCCCPKCGIDFDSEAAWDTHINEVHEFNKLENLNIDKSKRCEICGLKMNTSLSCIQQHCFRHIEFKSFKCSLCQYGLVSKDEALRHIKLFHINHRNRENFRIQKQKNNVPRDVDLPILMRFLAYYCPRCGECFDSEEQWEDHIDAKHNYFTGDALQIHPFDGCSVCGWRIKEYYITTMQIHAFKHMPYKTYTCKLCGFASSNRKLIQNHVKETHKDYKTIDLSRISIVKQEQSDESDAADVGGKDGKSEKSAVAAGAALKVNPAKKTKDVVAEIYKYLLHFCPQCGVALSHDHDWEHHIRTEHDLYNRSTFNIVDNKCNICGVTFKSKKLNFWQRHYFSHLPHPAYRCQICRMAFVFKCTAYQHIRSKHFNLGAGPGRGNKSNANAAMLPQQEQPVKKQPKRKAQIKQEENDEEEDAVDEQEEEEVNIKQEFEESEETAEHEEVNIKTEVEDLTLDYHQQTFKEEPQY